ncbi:sugar ABC transporter permease [Candidatus Synechococcus calcipolaris G9]|uniref:Sugar ABC transporter permease n=1 Tax=Candidatus Synechococcus calcipolaris G9 TaxID=1497997 RepID=A0ABT6F1B3_9SYNE|nr:sugar ABC transporter permease [Candidatus Synechococcus calcipolaris]MDG2991610.1 sugar ABC transporter permease [Candidatus Synechococcus calcipolaris G9]
MQNRLTAWGFLFPALVLLTIFVFGPIIYVAILSFTAGSFTPTGMYWVGWQNYARLLASPDFWQVLGNTLYFTVATVIPSLVIPLGLAVGLNQAMVGRTFLRTIYFLPSVASIVAAGLGFRWLFQPEGPVNALLQGVGIEPISWLGSPVWAMPVLILLSIWKQLGFNMIVFLAGLQTIPQSRYEAATLDGANAWQQFRYITLPGLGPTLVLAAITTTIFTLRSFEQVYVVTGGGPLNTTNLLVYFIYQQAFGMFDFGYAAAAATILLLATLGLVWLQLRTWQDQP